MERYGVEVPHWLKPQGEMHCKSARVIDMDDGSCAIEALDRSNPTSQLVEKFRLAFLADVDFGTRQIESQNPIMNELGRLYSRCVFLAIKH